ncbi:hypothetical protein ACFSC4_02845 [Deinococcus malanensis]|uniref:hypothetical protein n=1 Tax=Deinococcus malanensis TaxID=1706855 RepID=UPI00362AC1B3
MPAGLGLLALSVATDNLGATLEACRSLHFTGAIVHPTLESHLPDVSTPDAEARRVGRVDALAFAGGPMAFLLWRTLWVTQ